MHDDEMNDGLEDVEGADLPEEPVALPPRKSRGKSAKAASSEVGVGRPGKTGTVSLDAPFHNSEAEALWPEIIDRLLRNGRTPHELSLRVIRTDPPPRMTITTLDGSSVVGSENQNAGDALIEAVTEHAHLPTQRTAARYDIQFVWKINGQIWTRGTLQLPGPDAIVAMRRSLQNYRPASGVGQVPAPYVAPQPLSQLPNYGGNSYPGTQYPPVNPGLGAPYSNPRELELQADLQRAHEREAYLKGQLERAGLQPQVPPQTLGTPPASDFETRLNRIESMLERLAGVGQPQPQAQAIVPVAPAPLMNQQTQMNQMMANLQDMFTKQMYSAVEKTMKSALAGFGAPKPEESEEEGESQTMAPIQKPSEEDELPFKGIKVPDVKWPDGSDVYFGKEKEGFRPHPIGMLMTNPYLATKVVDVVNKMGETVIGAVKSNFPSAPPPPAVHMAQQPMQIPAQTSQPIGMGQSQAQPQYHDANGTTNGAGGLKFNNGWG